jgi:predicted kinase
MSGLAGSGKSTIADAIGRALQIPVLSVDPIEAAIVEAGVERSFETGLAAYLVAEVVARGHLRAGLSVVIDAANYVEEGREIWRGLAARTGGELRVIVVEIAAAARASRLSGRDRGLAVAEPDAAFLAAQQEAWRPWEEPHLTLDGTADLASNLERALAFVR